MDVIITHIVFLFIIALLVALIAHRVKLPYTVGLVLTGVCLNLAHVKISIPLTHEFIFDVILPPLLFEAAINIHWKELKRDILPILALAVFGVIVSAIFVAWGTSYFLHWPLYSALVFGVIIAATDPVAVIAMFKDIGLKGRLRLLVESESLFNDGVAAVLFATALSLASGGDYVSPLATIKSLLFTIIGGVFIGGICSIAAVLIAGRIADYLIETTLTTVVAYGAFFLAEQLHVSGVLAAITAGLVIGNVGICGHNKHALSDHRKIINTIWEFIAFLANSLIFLLIGLRVAAISFPALGILPLITVVLLVLVGRALAVYPLCLPFSRSKWAVPIRDQHVLWWGGLRGALGLALALSLPDTLSMHDEIVIATFGVVVFSVIIQGLTMPLLLKSNEAV